MSNTTWLLFNVSFSYTEKPEPKITVKKMPNGIMLSCGETFTVRRSNHDENVLSELSYRDENSGEYECHGPEGETGKKIYVKFRSKCCSVSVFVFKCTFCKNVISPHKDF